MSAVEHAPEYGVQSASPDDDGTAPTAEHTPAEPAPADGGALDFHAIKARAMDKLDDAARTSPAAHERFRDELLAEQYAMTVETNEDVARIRETAEALDEMLSTFAEMGGAPGVLRAVAGFGKG